MRMLICTQAVDSSDPALGFFVKWVRELGSFASSVHVVCLSKGAFELPLHVQVHSLGKKVGASGPHFSLSRKIRYGFRFLSYIWRLRRQYDVVFVHQNQEYVLIAGFLWKLLGKRVYLWRNHYAGSLLTDVAVALSTKVFCTSKHSYTAKSRKMVLMPIGVDLEAFSPDPKVARKSRSILSLGRIAPSKHLRVLVDALARLREDRVDFSAAIFGDPARRDVRYADALAQAIEERALVPYVSLHPAVPNWETPAIYNRFQIFVNTSESGMLDKTIFEAAACGCTVIASSRDFAEVAGDQYSFRQGDALDCAGKIAMHLGKDVSPKLREIAGRNSLTMLADRLISAMAA